MLLFAGDRLVSRPATILILSHARFELIATPQVAAQRCIFVSFYRGENS